MSSGLTLEAVDLLRRLINADREYRTLVHKNDPNVQRHWRGIEIGWECNRRTADVLISHELAEAVEERAGQSYLYLGKYEPFNG